MADHFMYYVTMFCFVHYVLDCVNIYRLVWLDRLGQCAAVLLQVM